jgi:hypothetical protein
MKGRKSNVNLVTLSRPLLRAGTAKKKTSCRLRDGWKARRKVSDEMRGREGWPSLAEGGAKRGVECGSAVANGRAVRNRLVLTCVALAIVCGGIMDNLDATTRPPCASDAHVDGLHLEGIPAGLLPSELG